MGTRNALTWVKVIVRWERVPFWVSFHGASWNPPVRGLAVLALYGGPCDAKRCFFLSAFTLMSVKGVVERLPENILSMFRQMIPNG